MGGTGAERGAVKFTRVVDLIALVISLSIFALDWSTFNNWDPELVHFKPIGEVWWHFPIYFLVTWSACRYLLSDRIEW